MDKFKWIKKLSWIPFLCVVVAYLICGFVSRLYSFFVIAWLSLLIFAGFRYWLLPLVEEKSKQKNDKEDNNIVKTTLKNN